MPTSATGEGGQTNTATRTPTATTANGINHLSSRGLHARTVKLKLRLSDFTTFTRQKTLAEGVESSEAVDAAARALLRAELAPGRLFRLVGVGVAGFDEVRDGPVQPRLAGFE